MQILYQLSICFTQIVAVRIRPGRAGQTTALGFPSSSVETFSSLCRHRTGILGQQREESKGKYDCDEYKNSKNISSGSDVCVLASPGIAR